QLVSMPQRHLSYLWKDYRGLLLWVNSETPGKLFAEGLASVPKAKES
ncbi:6430_t:CDS:1, partial [Ambispora leptoticha]